MKFWLKWVWWVISGGRRRFKRALLREVLRETYRTGGNAKIVKFP